MGDLEFKINSTNIHQNSEIIGTIDVSYQGRYDGVVVNTTILDSNEHIIYKSYNQKRYHSTFLDYLSIKTQCQKTKQNFLQLLNLNQHKIMK